MPGISSTEQNASTTDVASLYKELESAERTADVLEGRLESLEKRLDELLAVLEAEESKEDGGS